MSMQPFTVNSATVPSISAFNSVACHGGRCKRIALVWLAVFSLITGYLTSSNASAQSVPLAEMVPLAELDTPTDDLIRLATTYADAIKELKTAKLTLDTLQNLRPNAVITGLEVRVAQVNAETAQTKATIVRAIVEKQLMAAQTKLDIVKRIDAMDNQNANGTGSPEGKLRVTQAEATVAILKMVLAMK